jgi:hypothetical protein
MISHNYSCKICNKQFYHKIHFDRHKMLLHPPCENNISATEIIEK